MTPSKFRQYKVQSKTNLNINILEKGLSSCRVNYYLFIATYHVTVIWIQYWLNPDIIISENIQEKSRLKIERKENFDSRLINIARQLSLAHQQIELMKQELKLHKERLSKLQWYQWIQIFLYLYFKTAYTKGRYKILFIEIEPKFMNGNV